MSVLNRILRTAEEDEVEAGIVNSSPVSCMLL